MRGPVHLLAVGLCLFISSACVASIYNQNVTNAVIYGTGNSNGGFAVDQGFSVEVGLRAHRRYPTPLDSPAGIMHQGLGVYGPFEAEGYTSGGVTGGPRGSWNFDWSINSSFDGSGTNLDQLTYLLEIDYNPSQGTTFTSFDPIRYIAAPDNSIGDNSTGPNAGVEVNGLGLDADFDSDLDEDSTDYGLLIANKNLAQNSWNLAFFSGTFDPTADATYTIKLSAFRADLLLATTSIDVIVGAGGAAVPEPMTFLTWCGLIGCAVVAARRPERSSWTAASKNDYGDAGVSVGIR